MGFLQQARWKALLAIFKIKRFFHNWFGRRRLDYQKKQLYIGTATLREYDTRAESVKKEPTTVAWIEKYAKDGTIFYDIGANIGAYSLIAASLGMHVYAFEPAHQNVAALRENIDMNNFGSLMTIVPLMLGEGAGIRRFEISDKTSGSSAGFFSGSAHIGGQNSAAFLSLKLDECVKVFSLPLPSLLKIDVDGGEVEVLASAKTIIANRALQSMLVETADTNAEEVKRLTNEAGFAVSFETRMDARTVNYIFERP